MNFWPGKTFQASLGERFAQGGFRKWYERELLSSHAYMVLTLLSVIGVLGSLEASRGAPTAERLMDGLFVLVCAAIGLWSLRRYLFLLTRAEAIANQASCSDCGEYGRFEVVACARLAPDKTEVRCRKCAHQWTISSLGED